MMTTVYWSLGRLGDELLMVAATEQGLCYVQYLQQKEVKTSEEEALFALKAWGQSKLNSPVWHHDPNRLKPYLNELEAYGAGGREVFTLPLDMRGTAFQMRVWQALQAIPYGVTATYSEVAAKLDRGSAVRAVGTAIGANPVLIAVPCHRVVGKDGSLTGYRGGLANKANLLRLEGAGVGVNG
ncbi:methylated-DNA--[protein]-cysteine S-methyltransferase [Paenibacillus ferrarius]|uniref:methylated-DNA--[protein]-cysteine S-methyltransferase n=1 Tax=Paenibacillus ferrarius TaxID=1469647 RepID=UPI003D2AFF37